MIPVGYVREIVRYPIKSMAGVKTDAAIIGWHGLDGDRRFAFRRLGDESGFPWLSASRLPQLLRYQPTGHDQSSGEPLPTHVRTPNGSVLELSSAELSAEIGEGLKRSVELMKLKHGIFDEAAVSVISLTTISAIGRAAGMGSDLDRRRFRMNIFIETENTEAFGEDRWIGQSLRFGDTDSSPIVNVTMPDERCVIVNLDPDTADNDGRVMQAIVRLNQNNAGVYGTVVRTGRISIGDRVSLVSDGIG